MFEWLKKILSGKKEEVSTIAPEVVPEAQEVKENMGESLTGEEVKPEVEAVEDVKEETAQ